MEINAILITLTILLALISPIVYAISMIQGRSRPARMTRFIVWLAASIAFISLWSDGSTGAVWLAGIFALRNTFLLGMSLKYGVGGLTTIDKWCLVFAGVGLLGWQLTGNPLVALLFAIIADFVGFVPALVKTYIEPRTEGPWFYYLESTAVLLNIIVIGAWSIDLLFPAHILLMNILMLSIIFKLPHRIFSKG